MLTPSLEVQLVMRSSSSYIVWEKFLKKVLLASPFDVLKNVLHLASFGYLDKASLLGGKAIDDKGLGLSKSSWTKVDKVG